MIFVAQPAPSSSSKRISEIGPDQRQVAPALADDLVPAAKGISGSSASPSATLLPSGTNRSMASRIVISLSPIVRLIPSTTQRPRTSVLGSPGEEALSSFFLLEFHFTRSIIECEDMNQKRAYRYRCYPTHTQAVVLARTFGCARFVYNWALRLRTDAYYDRQERLGYHETSAALTALKRAPTTAWLNEVSSVPTQQALRHLDRAFRNFFAGRAKYPTFHKKHGAQSAEYTTSAFRWDAEAGTLTLAKMETPLHIHWSRPLSEGVTPTTLTLSRDTAGRYFVSILIEEEIAPLPLTDGQVGIDLGLHDEVVFDSGEKVGNPRFFAQDEKKLATAQRRLAKKKRGSKNRDKARRKVARIHARIADRRRDFTHKLSTRIIRENQTICIESLRVKAMGKHPTLAKAIHDVGWGEFVRQFGVQSCLVRAHSGQD